MQQMTLHKNRAGNPSLNFRPALTKFKQLSLFVVSASIAMTLVQALTAPVLFFRSVPFGRGRPALLPKTVVFDGRTR